MPGELDRDDLIRTAYNTHRDSFTVYLPDADAESANTYRRVAAYEKYAMRMKRFRRFESRTWERRIGSQLTWLVIALQWALLLTLWVTPTWQPPRVRFIELIWAWMHRPTFYPLASLTVVGPIATVMAWPCRGQHRRWLLLGWLAFFTVLVGWHWERITTMSRVLWWYVAG